MFEEYDNIQLEYITIPQNKPEFLDYLIKRGMIAKKDLQDGKTYIGHCRNSDEAIWDNSKQKFTYLRYKFGSSFNEDINHPEDDNGFDLFIPIKLK